MKRVPLRAVGKLADSLQIPLDLAYREPILSMTGSRELFIENYRCIRQYGETCILLQAKTGCLRIEGTCLGIAYYTNEEMKIVGNIRCISWV